MPIHWWPRLTLALMDSAKGNRSNAAATLVKFVESKPTYSRYTYLASFYQLTDQPEEAAIAMEKAVSYPIVDLDDEETNTECRGTTPPCTRSAAANMRR